MGTGLAVVFAVAGGAGLAAEARAADAPPGGPEKARLEAAALERRVAVLEESVERLTGELEEAKKREGFLSSLGEDFELGGVLEIDFIDTERESRTDLGNPTGLRYGDATDEPDPHIYVKRLRLKPRIRFTKEIDARAHIDLRPQEGESQIRELYARFRLLPGSELKVGLDDRFMRPVADDFGTEEYPLIGTAFWKYEAMGLFWESEIGRARGPWGEIHILASLTSGYELDGKGVGKDNSFEMIHDGIRYDRLSLREIGGGIGYRKRFGDTFLIDLLGFYYDDEMPSDDSSFLNAIPGYASNLRGRRRSGIQGEIGIGDFAVFAQYMEADDGRLDRAAWYVEPRYYLRFKDPLVLGKYLRWVEFLANYGELDTDLPRTTYAPATWDRRRFGLGVIVGVTDDVLLHGEYYFNRERTGGGDPDTDELLAQVELRF